MPLGNKADLSTSEIFVPEVGKDLRHAACWKAVKAEFLRSLNCKRMVLLIAGSIDKHFHLFKEFFGTHSLLAR